MAGPKRPQQRCITYQNLKRPKAIPPNYYDYLNTIKDGPDWGLKRLYKKLTNCLGYHMRKTGGSYYDLRRTHSFCEKPECFYCRFRLNGREVKMFHPAAHPNVEQLQLFATTINIAAYPLHASEAEILHANQNSRNFAQTIFNRVDKRIGKGKLAIFGHMEMSPIPHHQIHPYLCAHPISQPYVMVHLHCWVLTPLSRKTLTHELRSVISQSQHEPNRICIRTRTDDKPFNRAVSGFIDYAVKHGHTLKPEYDDPDDAYALARFRFHFRRDGLRGTRLSHGLNAMEETLDELKVYGGVAPKKKPISREFLRVSDSTSYNMHEPLPNPSSTPSLTTNKTTRNTTVSITVSVTVSVLVSVTVSPPVSVPRRATSSVGYRSRAPPTALTHRSVNIRWPEGGSNVEFWLYGGFDGAQKERNVGQSICWS